MQLPHQQQKLQVRRTLAAVYLCNVGEPAGGLTRPPQGPCSSAGRGVTRRPRSKTVGGYLTRYPKGKIVVLVRTHSKWLPDKHRRTRDFMRSLTRTPEKDDSACSGDLVDAVHLCKARFYWGR